MLAHQRAQFEFAENATELGARHAAHVNAIVVREQGRDLNVAHSNLRKGSMIPIRNILTLLRVLPSDERRDRESPLPAASTRSDRLRAAERRGERRAWEPFLSLHGKSTCMFKLFKRSMEIS